MNLRGFFDKRPEKKPSSASNKPEEKSSLSPLLSRGRKLQREIMEMGRLKEGVAEGAALGTVVGIVGFLADSLLLGGLGTCAAATGAFAWKRLHAETNKKKKELGKVKALMLVRQNVKNQQMKKNPKVKKIFVRKKKDIVSGRSSSSSRFNQAAANQERKIKEMQKRIAELKKQVKDFSKPNVIIIDKQPADKKGQGKKPGL